MTDISDKKALANRENSKLSTGPESAEGKLISSKNAIKNAIFTRDIMTPVDGQDGAATFRRLLDQLCEELRPEGILEVNEVHNIAVALIRKGRLVRFEAADMKKKFEQLKLSKMFSAVESNPQNRPGVEKGTEEGKRLREANELVSSLIKKDTELEIDLLGVPELETIQRLDNYSRRVNRELYKSIEHLNEFQQKRKNQQPQQ